jgi:hypothetical protein
MARMTWLQRRVRWVELGLIVVAGLGTALAGTSVGAPALASGATGGSPGETGRSPGETGTSPTGTVGCPASNPPNQMTLVAGTPQTAVLGSAFASGLQVELGNSDGCPVTSAAAGVPVTFSAPAGGASGVFSTSASNTVTVGADASGAVTAPPFNANSVAGSYAVTASSRYGSVSFSLTNTAAGVWCSTLDRRTPRSAGKPVKLAAGIGSTQSTPAGARFPIRLAVTVTDAEGNPVPGALITFSAPLTGASGRFTARARGPRHRARVSHPYRVRVRTDACGIAVAPAFTADDTRGGYIVEATVGHARPAAFALVNAAPGQSS